jgi:hypothetical protein
VGTKGAQRPLEHPLDGGVRCRMNDMGIHRCAPRLPALSFAWCPRSRTRASGTGRRPARWRCVQSSTA